MTQYNELLTAIVDYISVDSMPHEKSQAYATIHRHIVNREKVAQMVDSMAGPDWDEYDAYMASVEGDSSRGQA